MLSDKDLRQLDDLLARSPLALIAWDRQYRISYWSARAKQMYEYEASEVLGKTVDELALVHPEDLHSVHEIERRLTSVNMASLLNVNRNIRKNGQVRVCRWTTVAVQDDERYHVISLTEDITENVASQNALAESEERFRSLFEYNPDIIMIFSPDGRIIDTNHAITRISGAPRENVVGLHYSTFLNADDVPQHEMYLKRALAGETLFYHAGAHTLDGRSLDVEVTTVPVYRNGKIEAAFSIIRDQTEARVAQRRIEEQERELADSEARLHSLFEHNPDGVVSVSPEGVIKDVNEAALRLGGFPREGVIGEHFIRFLPPHEQERAQSDFERAKGGSPVRFTAESFRIDGTPLELDITIIPQFSGGKVVGTYSIIQDITERRVAERRAEMQSQRIRNLYFIAASGDYQDVRIRASLEMGARSFGVSVGAVIEVDSGSGPRVDAVYRDPNADTVSDDELIALARKAITSKGRAVPIVLPHGIALRIDIGGELYGALVFGVSSNTPHDFLDTDADLLGLISTLIAGAIDRSRQRARLRAMAYYDALTGLPNRVFLAEKLRDAIEVAQSRLTRVALLFLDLDRFKDVNDTLGHARGDRLLQLVAQRLNKELGHFATIARMGGDEFVVLLTDCADADAVRDAAERIIAIVSEPFLLDEYEQYISTSIGISVYPEDGRDDQTLIKNADIAMYRAKDRGRNGYYFYNPTLEAPIHMRLSQEKLLRRALELGEFLVFYQPQLDLRTGEIVAVEALVRWNHPKSGLIEPSHFIPSAEISGLIVPLGDWVFSTAAQQVKAWERTLGPIRLAVNLSGRQFHQRDLRRRVLQAIQDASLDPSMVEVEITESVAMSDAAQTVAIVRDLKAAGIRTAVDDFGTGYSSLAYLRRFALDVLKIDGSFVAGIGRETFDETIVKTVIGMSHSLGLEVVAEGVETLSQLAFLQEHGCDMVQGFVLAEPLPAEQLAAFVLRRRDNAAASG